MPANTELYFSSQASGAATANLMANAARWSHQGALLYWPLPPTKKNPPWKKPILAIDYLPAGTK
jgi:hypothetical protein